MLVLVTFLWLALLLGVFEVLSWTVILWTISTPKNNTPKLFLFNLFFVVFQ